MRLLLVEDDLELQTNLKQHLLDAHYSIDVASDGEEGLFQALECNYDAAIIDVGLPKLDGISLIRSVRQKERDFPILILTARDSWQDKVEGLDAGADDYLTKPFHPQELVARLKSQGLKVVVIFLSGRPMFTGKLLNQADAADGTALLARLHCPAALASLRKGEIVSCSF